MTSLLVLLIIALVAMTWLWWREYQARAVAEHAYAELNDWGRRVDAAHAQQIAALSQVLRHNHIDLEENVTVTST